MNPEQEDFQQLRRLLALKRHEQPPPGYFEGFSRQVIVRIRAGERASEESLAERYLWEVHRLQRLWAGLQARPALAGAFGVLVCGLVISGAVLSDQNEPDKASVAAASEASGAAERPVTLTGLTPVGFNGSEATSLSAVPTLPRPDSLFEEIRRSGPLRMQPLLQVNPQLEPASATFLLGQ